MTFCERKRQPRRENSQTDPRDYTTTAVVVACVCSPRCAVCGPLASLTYSVNAFAFLVFSSSSSFPAAKGQIDGRRCGGRNAEEGGGEM